MSQRNVELVRASIAAYLSGDVETALAAADPEIVTYRSPPLPDAGTYHGTEGVVQAYEDWTVDFTEFEMSTGEFVDAGDRVLVEVFQRATGRVSGAAVEAPFWFLYTVAGGKITRMDIFKDRRQALDAAGLRE
jgi:ketosteroid isomerase-like protein